MAGQPNRSGGSNRKPLSQHLLSGTYKASRQGALPAHVHELPGAITEADSWQPLPADLADMGAAGRRFVRGWLKRYDLSLAEGAILLEAGFVKDRLTALRAARDRTNMDAATAARWTRLERVGEAVGGPALPVAGGAHMKVKRATVATGLPFSNTVAAILLGGWHGHPPTSDPDPNRGFSGGLLELAVGSDQAVVDFSRAHEPQLRALAKQWGWAPTWRDERDDADAPPCFFAEWVAKRLANGQRPKPMRTSSARRLAVDPLDELRAHIATLETRLSALEAGRRNSAADRELRRTLAASTHGLPFKASELLRHAQSDPVLETALAAATLEGTRELGAWLRDAVGTRDNVRIVRLRGRRWVVTVPACSLGLGGD